jgi:enoyl-CoA hydratase
MENQTMEKKYRYFTLSVGEDGIAIFKANRTEVKNAMNIACWDEFKDFLLWAGENKKIRVIIISGEGDAFIAGAVIKEFMNLPPVAVLFSKATDVVRLLSTIPIPVIAAVNGAAFGGGFEIALASDIRIAASEAILGLPETSLGLVPGMGGTQRLCKLVGTGRAKEIIMAGRNIKGDETVALGLALKSVTASEVMNEAVKTAQKMLNRGPLALALVKRLINTAYSTDDETGLMLENLSFSVLLGSEEMKEGSTAFIEKRKPQFGNGEKENG